MRTGKSPPTLWLVTHASAWVLYYYVYVQGVLLSPVKELSIVVCFIPLPYTFSLSSYIRTCHASIHAESKSPSLFYQGAFFTSLESEKGTICTRHRKPGKRKLYDKQVGNYTTVNVGNSTTPLW